MRYVKGREAAFRRHGTGQNLRLGACQPRAFGGRAAAQAVLSVGAAWAASALAVALAAFSASRSACFFFSRAMNSCSRSSGADA